jgi:U8 snoRNA-decapping enzyme
LLAQMQMRFDGRFGFPGGHINNEESTIVGLNRELKEELGLDINEFGFKETDYAVTYLHKIKKFVLHFFVKEVTLENLKTIESNCIHAHEFGVEVWSFFNIFLSTLYNKLLILIWSFIGTAWRKFTSRVC